MSVTFWMPQAPVTRVQPYPEDEPDYWVTEPVAPFTEVNMANGNALAMLDLMLPGLDHGDMCGQWEGDTLAQVHRNCMRALNSPERRGGALADDVQEGNFLMFGRSDDYVTRRLKQMLELVTTAQLHGFYVSFG